jgi:hypothetical protein
MTRFEWTVDAEGRRYALRGMVSGTGELAPLASVAPAPETLVLDVGGIRAFTSSGVQGWIELLEALRRNGHRVVFERCSPAVVKQTGAIYDFLCGGVVRSILVPYVCPSCDEELEDELVIGGNTPAALALSRPCRCGAEMELDDLPQLYQALISNPTPPS